MQTKNPPTTRITRRTHPSDSHSDSSASRMTKEGGTTDDIAAAGAVAPNSTSTSSRLPPLPHTAAASDPDYRLQLGLYHPEFQFCGDCSIPPPVAKAPSLKTTTRPLPPVAGAESKGADTEEKKDDALLSDAGTTAKSDLELTTTPSLQSQSAAAARSPVQQSHAAPAVLPPASSESSSSSSVPPSETTMQPQPQHLLSNATPVESPPSEGEGASDATSHRLQIGLYHPEFQFCGDCSMIPPPPPPPPQRRTHHAIPSHLRSAATGAMSSGLVTNKSGLISEAKARAMVQAAPPAPPPSQSTPSPSSQQQSQSRPPPKPAAPPPLSRTTLQVQGVCCATEVPQVRALLRPWKANVSVPTQMVIVHHDARLAPVASLCAILTREGFPALCVHTNAAAAAAADTTTTGASTTQSSRSTAATGTTAQDAPPRSAFVESTLTVPNLSSSWSDSDVDRRHRAFGRSVRALHVSWASHTVQVEHDPTLIHADNVCTVLRHEYDWDASVLVDGAVERLYLPGNGREEGNSGNDDDGTDNWNYGGAAAPEGWRSSQKHLQQHVILSGVFWFISITAAVSSGWYRHFVYAGLLSVATGLPPVARKAYQSARRKQFDANCMMVLAAVGACALGEFDEAASVSFLFAVSEYLEAQAAVSARTALQEIVELRPEHAHVVLEDESGKHSANGNSSTSIILPAESVRIGSLIRVRTGDKLAADGVVVEGTSSLDQSSLTGESVPVLVTVGATVPGGSINIGSTQLLVRTTASSEDSAVSRLIRLVEDAQANQSATEKMVDSFARAYTPAVVSMAILMATLPWLGGIESGRYWTLNGLILIVIACPCALTISTPVTYAAGLAATAQRGIVCKGGATLEGLGSVTTVVLDKTGTITQGRFAVSAIHVIGQSHTRHEMLALLALMEAPSSHPLSATLVQAAKREGVKIPKDAQAKEHSLLKGEGVTALIAGKQVYVGNRRLFERIGMYGELPSEQKALADGWSNNGSTVGFLGVEGEGIIGSFCMTDVVRQEAKETIELMQLDGIKVIMLTGDEHGAANSVAQQVGLTSSAVHSQLLPEDKLHFVGSLKSPAPSSSLGLFRQQANVLFCGDGVNDAPALAVADVGVSMGEGAALAMEMSDVTLMDSNLAKLHYVLCMGRKVLFTIRENILLSLVCKVVVVVLTFFGYMTLLYAIASDVGVMLLVTLNGMKLLPRKETGIRKDKKTTSRLFAFLRGYNELPTDTSGPGGIELHGEII